MKNLISVMGLPVIIILVILGLALVAVIPVGYVKNVIGFCRCDFEPPYKAEIIRGVGIVFPPVGVVAGYVTIHDGPDNIVEDSE